MTQTKQGQHTAKPFRLEDWTFEYLEKCVNSHEALVNALVSMRTAFGDHREHDSQFKKDSYKACLKALKLAEEA